MEKTYRCSACLETKPESGFHLRPQYTQKSRPVAYHCKTCKSRRNRKEETERKRVRKGKERCVTCQKTRCLATRTQCNPCLEASGLKKCATCLEVKVVGLEFTVGSKNCDSCCASSPVFSSFMGGKAVKKSDIDTVLKARFGIGLIDYSRMERVQGGVCAVCGNPPPKRKMAVEKTSTGHCLVCVRCKVGLDSFLRSPQLLYQAAMVLLGTKGEETSPQ